MGHTGLPHATHFLRSRRLIVGWARDNRGLTLIELLIVMAIIATLSSIAVILYYDFSYRAQVARAIADVSSISSEIQTFHMMTERLPTSLAEINRATAKDPWGNPYEYFDIEFGGRQTAPRRQAEAHQLGLRPLQQGPGRRHEGKARREGESRRHRAGVRRPVHRAGLDLLAMTLDRLPLEWLTEPIPHRHSSSVVPGSIVTVAYQICLRAPSRERFNTPFVGSWFANQPRMLSPYPHTTLFWRR